MQSIHMKKTLAVALTAVVLMPSALQAKTFKDVTKDGPYSWAYSYIDTLSDQGIIKGYGDDTFRPDNSVSVEETLELIKELNNPSASELSEARSKYSSNIRAAGIASWAEDAVAYALSKGVVTTGELSEMADKKFFVESEGKIHPDRNSIAVYFGRGLGLDANGDQSLLRHDDKDRIPAGTRGYLASLVKAGIFASTGSDGKFEGTRYIRRSEMAKITKLSYDYLADEGQTATVEGTVVLATKANGINSIIIEKKDKTQLQLKVDSKTVYKENGKTIAFSDIKADQDVKITYVTSTNSSRSNVITTLDVVNSAQDYAGYITSRTTDGFSAKYTKATTTMDLTGATTIATTMSSNFKMASGAKLYVLGVETQPSQLNLDDMILFSADAKGAVKTAVVFPRNGRVNGEVVSISQADTNGRETIVLKLQDGKNYTFYGNTYNNYNPFYGNTSQFNGVRVGQKVSFSTNYKLITGTVDNFQGATLAGQVVNVQRNGYMNSYEVTVRSNGMDTRFYVDSTTRFEMGGLLNNQYNPQNLLHRYVVVERNGNYATVIRESNGSDQFIVRAKVLNVRTNNGEISFPGTTPNATGYIYSMQILSSNNPRLNAYSQFDLQGDLYTTFRQGEVLEITGVLDYQGRVTQVMNVTRTNSYQPNGWYSY
ncbi:S-layer homology domain-containing protein [Peptoniphilus equinus]|uniref:S-layer homology domain-containing protein n=1 Tax=Peptoniphilus equinus TaxID=3016343 RepID=A0ABY7QS33_9FIRM|nr:S-layer homology domain-containing protein [Peptoniphilus equinus]WBW49592.1 S-layer homology domain-containing protein [Peptoniphilus equinus]